MPRRGSRRCRTCRAYLAPEYFFKFGKSCIQCVRTCHACKSYSLALKRKLCPDCCKTYGPTPRLLPPEKRAEFNDRFHFIHATRYVPNPLRDKLYGPGRVPTITK